MKIFLFVDNWVGGQVLRHLRAKNEDIVGIAVHPPGDRNNFDEIKRYSGLSNDRIHSVGKNPSRQFIDLLTKLQPDIILVVFWTYMLLENIFNIPDRGCMNFHMSYLPFNRGKKPNVWPIVEGTPAGVSIHYIDDGIDSGKILFRKKVDVEIIDTAGMLYKKQIHAFVDLFKESWTNIKNNNLSPIDNILKEGTFHWDKDFKRLDELPLDGKYDLLDLINHLRAKTFPPHKGAYFIHNERKVFVRIELSYED
jgi:methionyl-tRNA formyltransferase